MSLTSRFSSFFTSEKETEHQPARSGSNNSQNGGGRHVTDIAEMEDRSSTMRTLETEAESVDFELKRPPYLHSMLAGGIGGTSGDLVMHSLDTVKTRQQGDPHFPPRYTSMSGSYLKIFRQEGIRRGLYGGVNAAMLGSFPGTVIFFGTYEYCKRYLLDRNVNASLAYLTGGFVADFAASIVYVPSEVLKTRLQLQGRYNNPYFSSGYNYRSTWDAAKTIVRTEGFNALYSGYKATIFRDLPFSALQFAFYEQEQHLAHDWVGGQDIGLGLEILTAASAGGVAGVITCPLDVVKTRTQTQITGEDPTRTSQAAHFEKTLKVSNKVGKGQKRLLHSGPRSVPTEVPILDTSSVLTGLGRIYKNEGVAGWFRGVGPRFVWTSVQSGTMLVLYQYLLKQMAVPDQPDDRIM